MRTQKQKKGTGDECLVRREPSRETSLCTHPSSPSPFPTLAGPGHVLMLQGHIMATDNEGNKNISKRKRGGEGDTFGRKIQNK